jgi:hypothetical protein
VSGSYGFLSLVSEARDRRGSKQLPWATTYFYLCFSGFVLIREGGFGFHFFHHVSMLPARVRGHLRAWGIGMYLLCQLAQLLFAQHIFQPLALRLDAVILLR